ncbi:T9SS type A sorting domain-containing protein [Pseudotamlana carrageenivorans]|uniref:Secretion system C-terminal sorting domain-containing protein n=1 Tax=Pseudotamlana carrageenivorans TaxID=2069432 RepID=A0A2I7SG80_9FLAO|nr:T9SS type A sorting domain-containing protein [Tamlana carrageenivorans]AUS04908.1 hypothetical protein C1A40_05230 [Tamlana carrageenivorans]
MKTKLLFPALFVAAFGFAQTQPTVLNPTFDKLMKSTGSSTCSCAGWMNTDLGDQAESSTNSGPNGDSDAIKFDGGEADIMYQEIAVEANSTYELTFDYQIKPEGSSVVTEAGQLEIRVLKGSGYRAGYTPVYQSDLTVKATKDFGYNDIAEVEASGKTIVELVEGFVNDDWGTATLTFSTGLETSIAIVARGIGRSAAPVDGKPYTWSNGDHEIRLDNLELVNTTGLSVEEAAANGFAIYPNPASDILNIKSKNLQISAVSIYDLLGKSVYKNNQFSGSIIDLSSFNKGVYFLKIEASGRTFSKKLVVQ